MATFAELAGSSITQAIIADGLRQLGLAQGDVVEVHSSLSSLGRVEGGASAVVDALISVVGEEGALVMSAYPVSKPLPLTEQEKARGILAKVHKYSLDYAGPTGMGAIADEFRRRPGVALGDGFHRICAALNRGYDALLELDGWALLIGVSIGLCSSMQSRKGGPAGRGQELLQAAGGPAKSLF